MVLADVTATTPVANSRCSIGHAAIAVASTNPAVIHTEPVATTGRAPICPFTHPDRSRIAHVGGALNPHNRLSSRPAASFNPA
jgi:hypothetical protein